MYENLYYAQRETNITNTYITQKEKINKHKESSVNLPIGDTIYTNIPREGKLGNKKHLKVVWMPLQVKLQAAQLECLQYQNLY